MTKLTCLTCNSSSEAAKKAITVYVEKRTDELIRQCLADGTQLDLMRDLWYEMKDDYEVVNSKEENETAKKHSDKLVKIIYDEFYNYAKTDPYVYDKLGLKSKTLIKGQTPIVVIFEKEKKVAIPIIDEFHAGYAFSTGQFPSFESVHLANYFNECGYSKGYVFVVSDYDPAGEELYGQVRDKMELFSDMDIEVNWVSYGEDALKEFDSYELIDNPKNRRWIDDGRTRGIEFNTPTNIRNNILAYIRKSILDHVDPRYYVLHSYNTWAIKEQKELANEDATYQEWKSEAEKLHKLMGTRYREFDKAVSMIQTDYTYDVLSDLEYGHFRTITSPREEYTYMMYEDIEYYYDLLGSRSPYADDSEQDELTDDELLIIMAEYAEGEVR